MNRGIDLPQKTAATTYELPFHSPRLSVRPRMPTVPSEAKSEALHAECRTSSRIEHAAVACPIRAQYHAHWRSSRVRGGHAFSYT